MSVGDVYSSSSSCYNSSDDSVWHSHSSESEYPAFHSQSSDSENSINNEKKIQNFKNVKSEKKFKNEKNKKINKEMKSNILHVENDINVDMYNDGIHSDILMYQFERRLITETFKQNAGTICCMYIDVYVFIYIFTFFFSFLLDYCHFVMPIHK
jgi:hypothetical protein